MTKMQAGKSFSETLRSARKASGRSLDEIAVDLKIRRRHLEALEEGRFDALPPPAFAAGFVRSYADMLGLDGCALARRFREEAGCEAASVALKFPEPVAESRLPGKSVLTSALVGVLAVYFGWIGDFDRGGEGAVAGGAVEPVPARLESAMKVSQEAARKVAAASIQEESHAAPEERAGAPSRAMLPQSEPAGTAVREAPAVAGETSLNPSDERRGRDADRPVRVTLTATSDAWLRIVDAMNREVWNGVLQAGESWSPQSDDLRLMTSNAGGLVITVDGKTLEPLGHGGDVVRDIPLDPDRLKRGLRLAYN